MKRLLRDEILADLAEAADWYDDERPGLGSRFLDAVEATLIRIEEQPRSFPLAYRDLRRALLPRPFPYQIYYRLRDDLVEVFAVFHGARDPREWQRRR